MKQLILLFFICCAALSLRAEKLTIINEDWAEAQKVAQAENKMIIIDYYTTWCGPCKMFSANLKKNTNLQSELSKNFIMLKYDAEKDKKFNLTKKYHVRAYPTFVIVTADLNYAGRLVGGALQGDADVNRFLDFTKEALVMKEKNSFPKGYNQSLKNVYPDFYVNSMNKEGKMKENALEDFWKTNRDFLSEVSFAVLSSYGGSEEANDYFLKNKESYVKAYGKEGTNSITQNMFSKKVYAAMKAKDEKQFDAAKKFAVEKAGMNEADLAYTEMRFASSVKNCDRFERALNTLKKNAPKSPGGVNSVCWMVYESECDNPTLIKTASTWMESFNLTEQDYAYMDTYACLLYKAKKYNEAKKFMDLAIAKAKATGENYDGSTKVLKLIENALN